MHKCGPEESGAAEDTYAIITTDANPVAAPVHARMPAILDKDACKIWLDPKNKDAAPLEKLLTPYQGEDLDTYPVSTYVNSPKKTGEACLKPVN
ncbi:MAG: SOS response-associated peptidase family protein [Gammaproteobacteria bacterium]